MSKPHIVIFLTVVLDSVGIGLIFPILPALLRDVSHADNVAPYIGAMAALYAALQFVFAPVLGAISDRVGRRPVLLVSLAGAVANYLLLAVAPNLAILLLARAFAGVTGANISVAMAYLTDVTPEAERPRRFGLFSAMFGMGFIIGPILGGVLGDVWVRLPFVAAALLTVCNLLMALFVLPESHLPSGEKIDLASLNPLRPLRWAASVKGLPIVVLTFLTLTATGESYGTLWALWSGDSFAWDGRWIGLSLGIFGVCHSAAQAGLPGLAVKWLGERATVLTGIACECVGLAIIAFATEGWMVFASLPLFALGGIGTPALQSMATRKVGADLQGQLQGVIASATSLASIVAPLGFSSAYVMLRGAWPGAVWLTVIAVYLTAVPLGLVMTREKARAEVA